jgi:deoxyribodipyrimidine photo-lyase
MGFIPGPHGASGVHDLLQRLETKLAAYESSRDYLYLDATSYLGIHLRFGTISIRKVLRFLIDQKKRGVDTTAFFRQLVFRDFYAYLLYHFPTLADRDYKPLVDYRFDKTYYDAFVSAQTGVPVVDAAVRELVDTGYMHNRARMVAASFFTKHLLLPWQEGEAFFAKYLLDFEKSSNVLSWQWAAGTGIDPQPYFRIFNPYTQAKRFDKDAVYIKKHLPQLSHLRAKDLHNEDFLLHGGIKGYPKPVVVHKQARKRALEAKR